MKLNFFLLTLLLTSSILVCDAGTKSLSMGGTGTACTDDALSQWLNPSVYGFMNRELSNTNNIYLDNNSLSDNIFGWSIVDFNFGITLHGNIDRYLDNLADIDFDGIISLDDKTAVRDLSNLAASFDNIASEGNGLMFSSEVISSFRKGSFGLGLGANSQLAVWVDELDQNNLGLNFPDLDGSEGLNSTIQDIIESDTSYISDDILDNFTGEMIEQLQSAGLEQDAAKYIDYQITTLINSGDITSDDVDDAVDFLVALINTTDSGENSLTNNLTSLTSRGFISVEVPISWGHAINDKFSLGATLSPMRGKVFGTKIWVFDDTNYEDSIFEDNYLEVDSSTFGVNIGALYRIPNFHFALVGKNLNKPTFDGISGQVLVNGESQAISVPEVEISPQLTFATAYMPSKRFLIEASIDFMDQKTIFKNYQLRQVSLGSEIDLRFLILRLGLNRNLSSINSDYIASTGLGFNLFGCRFDAGLAYSLGENIDFNNNEIPSEIRLGLAASLDF